MAVRAGESEAVSKLDLDAIEKRATQATAGPWTAEGTLIHNGRGYGIIHSNEDNDFLDLNFAAHARTDVPLLVARVRELEAALNTIEARRKP